MHAGNPEIKIQRVLQRKRPRDIVRTQRTPGRKRGGGPCGNPCPRIRRFSSVMADGQAAEYCSDSEDLFGGYDSILEDRSFLVKLDDAEQNERRSNAVDQQHLPTLQPSTDVLTDSITDSLGDFQDLPGSQIQFQEQVHEMMKRSRLEEGGNTSTPVRNWDRTETERQSRARRTDQLKRTMLCNAAAPSHVSRTVALKEAVVCEEISVAMQAIETVSAETTDLGPFFGLPSKVKDLMDKLRGIQSLYGDAPLSH